MQAVLDFDRRYGRVWLLQIDEEFIDLSEKHLVIFYSPLLFFLELGLKPCDFFHDASF